MKPSHALLLILAAASIAACSKGGDERPVDGAAENATVSDADPGSAPVTPEAARNAGIEVVAASGARIRETLTLYGTIKPNAEREQELRARYPGVVHSVAKRAGDAVTKGEELVSIEANESLQTYPIRSPLTGQVLERSVNPGDAVDGSAVLLKVADLSVLWAEFQVFARDLSHVRPKMVVHIADADADKSTEVRIHYVAPAGHADSQSVVARATVPNPEGRWVPGQFITGEVVVSDVQVAVATRPSALQELRGKTVVFVQDERGFTPREVEVGRRSRDAVEIVSGIAAGERYAAENSYLIKADLLKNEADED